MRRVFLAVLLVSPLSAGAADVSVSGNVSLRQGGTDINIGFNNRDREALTTYYRQGASRPAVRVEAAAGEADGEARGHKRKHKDKHDRDDDGAERKHKHKDKLDRDDDRGGKGMPPGLAKRGGDLPPGLKKKDRLPPGLAKRDRMPDDVHYEPLPRELEVKLTPLPDKNYVRVRVGKDIVLFNTKTRVVFDIQRDLAL